MRIGLADRAGTDHVGMMVVLLILICGAIALIRPDWLDGPGRRRHARRLAALDAGATERFFEERRTLLAYPPSRARWPTRVTGGIMIAAVIARAAGLT